MEGRKLTLQQASIGGLLALALLLGGFLLALSRASREAVVQSAGPLREVSAEAARRRVETYLQTAEDSIERIEQGLTYGPCPLEDPRCAENTLFSELLANQNLVEAAFTHGRSPEDDSVPVSAPARAPWQVSLSRPYGATGFVSRTVRGASAGFLSETRGLKTGAGIRAEHGKPALAPAENPTLHSTFLTPSSLFFRRAVVWSDLSFTELDLPRPEAERRVVVTVMKAIEEKDAVVGVARVALLEDRVDALVAREPGTAQRLFLCDEAGRLLSRLEPGDPLQVQGEDLRVAPSRVPPEIAKALALASVGGARPATATFDLDGRRFLATFRALHHTQGWRLGVVVAEDELPGIADLASGQRRLFLGGALVATVVLLGGLLGVRLVQRDLARIVETTTRMVHFDFARSPASASFSDVAAVMTALEQAKTSLRALSKYVPVDLVRQLYESGKEPFPGGELHDCSLMFTDLQGFTTLSEEVSPDTLARLLGGYFEAMGGAIQGTGGTIDKFIGDAVMALWNAPSPLPDHPSKACEAAIRAIDATGALYRSPQWEGRAPLRTRFGLHRDSVMLGHFGAPDRLSYTALGDGVNLASRLEGLNKAYGTTILVSQSIHDAASEGFAFRVLDRVAVKGKTKGILVFELLGRQPLERPPAIHAYEAALALYWERDFAGALAALEGFRDDPPSRVLLERCRRLRADPPPRDWDGVFVATEK